MIRARQQKEEMLESVIGYHLAILNATRNRFYKQLSSFIILSTQKLHKFLGSDGFANRVKTELYLELTEAIIQNKPSEAKGVMKILTNF